MSPSPTRASRKYPQLVWALVALVSIAGLIGTYMLFVEPPPPNHLVIATGSAEGAYYKFAQQYAEELKKEGLTLKVMPTKGSIENLQLLQDDGSGVEAALVQSGVANAAAAANLVALGSLYREPLWVFYRASVRVDLETPSVKTEQLGQFAGKRIAIGPPGSGTRAIALLLLAANNVTDAAPGKAPASGATHFSDLSGQAAVDALKKGDIDVVFLVAAIETPYIRASLADQSLRLVSLNQQAAYLRQFRFLAQVTVPAGLADLAKNIPSENVSLVAPTAMLVVRKDLHPALASLLLSAASKVHAGGDLLSSPGEFPSPSYIDLPLSEEAHRYYKSGPPFLQRYLPFWLASLVDRLKVMLIPLVMVLMPMVRAAPPLVRWRTRRKVYLWYSSLREIDHKFITGMSEVELRAELAKLRELEQQVAAHVEVPLSYMEEFYNLRLHIHMMEEKLEKWLADSTHAGALLE